MIVFVSGTAFALLVILTGLLCSARLRNAGHFPAGILDLEGWRGVVGGCLAVAAFFFVPPGSLPPFFNHAFGGVFFLACLAGSLWLAHGFSAAPGLAVFAVVCGISFFYARHRGMPGGFANLGTFAAIPLWSIASFYECVAFLLLALGSVLAARSFAAWDGAEAPPALGVSFMASCALIVTLFLPWTCAPHVYWPVWAAAGCDFVLFWVKTACCVYGISKLPFPMILAGRAAVFCAVAGAALLFMTMD